MENNKEAASYIDDIKTRVTDMLPRIISWMLLKENGETLPELLAKAKRRYFAIVTAQPEDTNYKQTYLTRMGGDDRKSIQSGVKAHYMAAMALYNSYDCGHTVMHMLDHLSEGGHEMGTESELGESLRGLIDIPLFEECRDWELLDHCARMAAYDLAFDEAMSDGMAAMDIIRELSGAENDNTLLDAYDKHRERYAKTIHLDGDTEDDDDSDE